MSALWAATLFLAANVVALFLVYRASPPQPTAFPEIEPPTAGSGTLDPVHVLGWEYDYIRNTATEAMQDRHTMVNFYLLVTGGVATGVLTIFGAQHLDNRLGTLLLWLYCGVGWLYFLKLVKLRRSWGESAAAMSQIKEFCMRNAKGVAAERLRSAFLWSGQSVPEPAKRWTVFFYSAMLVAYLDSVAFVVGALMLRNELPEPTGFAGLLGLGVLFFALHVAFYQLLLAPKQGPAAGEG